MKLTNRWQKNRDLGISIILVLLIVTVLNYLSLSWFWRWDLTAKQIYSLSPVSQQLVKKLPDIVKVKVYFSQQLPQRFLAMRQSVSDLLAEYASYSHNFQYEMINPTDGASAEAAGIQPLQFNDYSQDKLEVVNGYMGMVIAYQGQQKVIPVLDSVDTLEYKITSSLQKLTSAQQPVVALFVGAGAPQPSQEMSVAYNNLADNYQLQTVDLLTADNLDQSVKTLIIAGVTQSLSEEQLQHLSDFLASGRSVIVLLDGMTVNGLQAEPNQSNLIEWLAQRGVQLQQDLVLDQQSGLAAFNQGLFSVNLRYPFWPLLTSESFAQSDPAVANLDGVVLPWTSSLNLDQSKLDQAQTEIIARSSQHSWSETGSFSLDPAQIEAAPANTQPLNLAVSLKYPASQGQTAGRLLVVADSDFIKDGLMSNNTANQVFLANLVDSATLSENLFTIRAKSLQLPTAKTLTDSQRQWLRYGNVFGLVILVFLLGVLRYYLRKRSKHLSI